MMNRGRKIPKNRKPRYCPQCDSGNMVKKGFQYGTKKQKWLCKDCGVITAYPNKEKQS